MTKNPKLPLTLVPSARFKVNKSVLVTKVTVKFVVLIARGDVVYRQLRSHQLLSERLWQRSRAEKNKRVRRPVNRTGLNAIRLEVLSLSNCCKIIIYFTRNIYYKRQQ